MSQLLHMPFGKKLHHVLSLVFSLHLLVFHGGLPGYVLCFGSDGQVAVELAVGETGCVDGPQSNVPFLPGETDVRAADHCGDCRDILLISDCADEQARLTERATGGPYPPSAVPAVIPANPLCCTASRHPGGDGGSPIPSLALVSLRTTVLRN